MTASFPGDIENYETYARHCLKLASHTPDRESRLILREMAAEWLKLALPDGLSSDTIEHEPPLNGARLST